MYALTWGIPPSSVVEVFSTVMNNSGFKSINSISAWISVYRQIWCKDIGYRKIPKFPYRCNTNIHVRMSKLELCDNGKSLITIMQLNIVYLVYVSVASRISVINSSFNSIRFVSVATNLHIFYSNITITITVIIFIIIAIIAQRYWKSCTVSSSQLCMYLPCNLIYSITQGCRRIGPTSASQ